MNPKPDACQQVELTRWAARGEGAGSDAALEQHLADCADCSQERASILEVRTRLAALPTRRIASERLDAMRFELVAAARGAAAARRPPPSTRPPSSSRPPRRLERRPVRAAALGAIMLAAAAAFVLAWPSRRGHEQVAEIELAEGASGLRSHQGPDEIYALLRGSARFHVRPLQPGERFRVVAGGDSVEVRGTRFGVEVDDGRITMVDVVEGAVVLSIAEGDTQLLTAGQSWRRPIAAPTASNVAAAAAEPPVAEPTGSGDVSAQQVRVPGAAAASSPAPKPVGAAAPTAPSTAPATGTASGAPGAPSAQTTAPRPDAGREAAFDARFQRAMQLLKGGAPGEAAMLFDALGQDASVDDGRRGDALYWAAQSHAKAGRSADAEQRARALAESRPGSWHADGAALMVGESLLERGDVAAARPWLERAARSPRESVRARAQRALQRATNTAR